MRATGTGSAVECYGVDQVLNSYDLHCSNRDNVYYSVWQGGVIKFVYDGGQCDQGRELLEQNLDAWAQNGNTALYTLKLHPTLDKNGFIANTSPVNGSINFKFRDNNNYNPTPVAGAMANDQRFEQILALLLEQNKRIEELELQPEDVEEVVDESGMNGIINGLHKVEQTIQNSPALRDIYDNLKLGWRIALKKWAGDSDYNAVLSGLNAENNAQKQSNMDNQSQAVDMSKVTKELVANFPELPHLLVRLWQVMNEDRDTFDLAKKKIIDGVQKL